MISFKMQKHSVWRSRAPYFCTKMTTFGAQQPKTASLSIFAPPPKSKFCGMISKTYLKWNPMTALLSLMMNVSNPIWEQVCKDKSVVNHPSLIWRTWPFAQMKGKSKRLKRPSWNISKPWIRPARNNVIFSICELGPGISMLNLKIWHDGMDISATKFPSGTLYYSRWHGYLWILSFNFSTENYLLTGLSLVAELGGMAGLLLGVSFYHVALLIVFLIEMWFRSKQSAA